MLIRHFANVFPSSYCQGGQNKILMIGALILHIDSARAWDNIQQIELGHIIVLVMEITKLMVVVVAVVVNRSSPGVIFFLYSCSFSIN